VSLVDLPESLVFSVGDSDKGNFKQQMDRQENSQKALFHFIDTLSSSFDEKIYYMGQDVIGEKFYYRFQFGKQGFLEVMNQAPVSIIAHFIDEKRAKLFFSVLKKNLSYAVREDRRNTLDILLANLELSKQTDEGLKVETHAKLARIRETINKF
jgi:hypothetical protein